MEEEIKSRLAENCRSLKPPYNEIARDYYLREMSAQEIAHSRNVNLKTIETQSYRARDLLRKIYGKEGTA